MESGLFEVARHVATLGWKTQELGLFDPCLLCFLALVLFSGCFVEEADTPIGCPGSSWNLSRAKQSLEPSV